ncbi:MAG: hypothetical protein IKR13_06580, partial [Victivallales bacterium]|nr:hypothetical protein [Victivallales bacterium]
MKKAFVLFVALLLGARLAAQCSPDDFTVSFEGGGLTIETYDGEAEEVIVPAQLGGHPVRRIADWAFTGDGIQSIVIPGTVIHVSELAFYGCSKLEFIEFEGSLPADAMPFKGLSRQQPPVIRSWQPVTDGKQGTYRGLPLECIGLAALPMPRRMDGETGHLFEGSLSLTFPE